MSEVLILDYEDRLQRPRTVVVPADFDLRTWFDQMKKDGWWTKKYKLSDIVVRRATLHQ